MKPAPLPVSCCTRPASCPALFLVPALAMLGGCAADPAPARSTAPVLPSAQVVDGVLVLTHEPDAFERAPLITIGDSVTGRYDVAAFVAHYDPPLFEVRPVVLDDGTVAVADQHLVRLLHRETGRAAGAVGLPGRGPQTFSFATGVARMPGDTLVIVDALAGRLLWIQPGSAYASTRVVPAVRSRMMRPQPVGVLPGGRVVLFGSHTALRAVPDTVIRPLTPLGVATRDNDDLRVIAELPGAEMARADLRGGAIDALPVHLGRRTHAVVWDTLIAVGTARPGYEIDVLNADGARVATIRVPRPDRPLTRDDRDRHLHLVLRDTMAFIAHDDVPAQLEVEAVTRARPFAATLPPYDAFFATPNGTLWVLDAIGPRDRYWTATAFRADGAIIGRMQGTSGNPPVAFTEDAVLVWTSRMPGYEQLRKHAWHD